MVGGVVGVVMGYNGVRLLTNVKKKKKKKPKQRKLIHGKIENICNNDSRSKSWLWFGEEEDKFWLKYKGLFRVKNFCLTNVENYKIF